MESTTPKTLIEAVQKFSNPQYAHNWLMNLRWPDGVVICPHCQSTEVTFMAKYSRWNCRDCKGQFSVKYGTIFEKSPISLGTWLTAVWLLVSAKNGVSSCELARSLGVTQKTAWFMEHRIRVAMERGTFVKLDGEVEVDETWVGGKSKNMHADRRREMRAKGFPKTCVMGMKERDGEVRTMVVQNREMETLHGQIEENVEEGATIYTDAWKGYNGLDDKYEHGVIDHNVGQYANGEISTNGMENYWSVFKRAYHGTYIHFSDQHTHRYLAEEDFRYNTRKQKDGERFAQIIQQVSGKRLTYDKLTTSHLQFILPK